MKINLPREKLGKIGIKLAKLLAPTLAGAAVGTIALLAPLPVALVAVLGPALAANFLSSFMGGIAGSITEEVVNSSNEEEAIKKVKEELEKLAKEDPDALKGLMEAFTALLNQEEVKKPLETLGLEIDKLREELEKLARNVKQLRGQVLKIKIRMEAIEKKVEELAERVGEPNIEVRNPDELASLIGIDPRAIVFTPTITWLSYAIATALLKGHNVLLVGPPGAGKTTLAWLALRTAVSSGATAILMRSPARSRENTVFFADNLTADGCQQNCLARQLKTLKGLLATARLHEYRRLLEYGEFREVFPGEPKPASL
ncbi:MAG: hypothetical protein DRJ55_05590, partial [Thermoprotei archaeon]